MTIPSRSGHVRVKARTLLAAAAVATTAVALAVPAAASAATARRRPAGPAVFVQTDNTAGNQVVAYDRAETARSPWPAHTPPAGSAASCPGRSSTTSPRRARCSTTRAQQPALRRQRGQQHGLGLRGPGRPAPSAGRRLGRHVPGQHRRPRHLVYVLNALHGGSVQGFRLSGGPPALLRARTGRSASTRRPPRSSPTRPGQVAFSPDGSELIVTTKANGSDIDVFGVGPAGGCRPARW